MIGYYQCVYGPVLNGEVDDFLEELDNIKARWNLPWCIGGDFNLIRYSHEMKDMMGRDTRMIKFRYFIDRWKLIDGPLKGSKYTWSNFHDNSSMSQLDRFLFCNNWEELFPCWSQVALTRSLSDHTPILLGSCWGRSVPYSFKFEEVWFVDPDFMVLVEVVWNQNFYSGNASRVFTLKLKNLKFRLKAWSKVSSGYFKEERKRCLENIRIIDLLEEDRSLSIGERLTREGYCKEFQILAVKEEIFWRQRSRVRWLKGDRNTKFFHKVASQNKCSNDIRGLWINGEWTHDQNVIKSEMEAYYMK